MNKNYFNLDSKLAVVTGGLGQLGQQFSVSLTNYGAKVVVLDVADKAKKSISEFDEAIQTEKIKIIKGDILDRKFLESTLKEVSATWGVPNILVNNAAIDSPPNAPASENAAFEDYPESSLDKVIQVNLKGPVLCSQVFGGAMAKNSGGSIINIGSIYGMLSPNQDIYEYKRTEGDWFKPVGYAITKAGIINLTRYMATYWAKKGVRVNCLSPAGIFNNQDEEFLKGYQMRMPMGRMAREDEMNSALIFLASDGSSYMTGANLVVDGGWTAW